MIRQGRDFQIEGGISILEAEKSGALTRTGNLEAFPKLNTTNP